MYNTVLFDLDGTLSDPGDGITNSVAYALRRWGIEVSDRSELYRFIGPPLVDSFMDFYGFSIEQAELAVETYRKYFKVRGIYENKLYRDIPDVLDALKKEDKRLIVATSKPEEFARRILKYFSIDSYFDFIAGATMDGSRSRKADVIRYALGKCNITELGNAVMVGDRKHDIMGAREVGLDSIGVLYGYGNRAELELAGATYIIEKEKNIVPIIV